MEKKKKIKETDEKRSVLSTLQSTPVNDTIQSKKKDVIIRTHLRAAFLRIITFVVICVFVFTCIFGVKTIESNDMYPAVRSGDVVLYFRLSEPKNLDAVIYKTEDGDNVGRIQAVEGTEIGVTNKGEITLNDDIQPIQKKQGVFYETFKRESGIEYPYTVNPNEYFILGDERDSAKDSRVYGTIRRRDIKGKIFMTLRRRAI